VGLCFGAINDLEVGGDLSLTGDEKKLIFYEGTNYITFKAPSTLSADYDYTLPPDDGDSGQYLRTDGSGALTFSTPSGAGDMLKATYDADEDGLIDLDGGGTELDSSGVTNGQLLIGNSTGNVFGLAAITGTSNQITVTNGASSITLSAPQDLAAASDPTFDNLTVDTVIFSEQSSNPDEPTEGKAVIWMSDGTGFGYDGDVMIASTAGGVAKYGTLFDHSGGTPWAITDVLLLSGGVDKLYLDDGASHLLIRQ
jgi:hypothetical protein